MNNNCRYNMDRFWKFYKGECSIYPEQLTHDAVYGFAKTGGVGGVAADGFDDSTWETLDLPHDWMHAEEFDLSAAADHGYRKGSQGWYRRRFLLEEEDRNKSLSIVFDGIGGKSTVYLNGIKLVRNESRYNSFSVDITEVANFGAVPNVLAIEVDSREWEGWWYEGAGIYRHVWLLKEPPIHVKNNGVFIKPAFDEINHLWHTDIQVELENNFSAEEVYTLTLKVLDKEGNESCKQVCPGKMCGYTSRTELFSLDQKNPILWDIENPYLYTLEINLKCGKNIQRIELPFGYRTISVDSENGFWLNGKNIKLLGTCNHQDHAGIGVAVPDTVVEYRINQLKKMGCNAYRCAHHNPSPELLDICDRLGILVMDENRSFSTAEQSIKYLKDMIYRDRNHPCVIMYSIFNEEPLQGTSKGKRIAQKMVAKIKEWDNTRPVLGAFNGGYLEKEGASDVFDIVGINYFTDTYDVFHREFPNQPVVASELMSAYSTRGAAVTDPEIQEFDNYDRNKASWGETVREGNYDVFSRKFVMGMFVWTGFDYRGEPSPYEWPSVSSHFGILDTCGYPKDTFYLYQALWRKEKILHLVPHWNHKKGDTVKIMTYSNCNEIELFLNGNSLGRRKNNLYEQCEWMIKFEPGVLEAIGYCQNGEIVKDRCVTAKETKAILLTSYNKIAFADTKDAVILDIQTVDENVNPTLDSNIRVSVTVDGGALLGMGNGNPNGHEPDKGPGLTVFRGKCQAILKADGSGLLRAVVTAPGMEAAEYTWQVKERKTEKEVQAVETQIIKNWKVAHQIWQEKPDPMMKVEKSDMNTLEPIEFNGSPLVQLRGMKDYYCLYRSKVSLPKGEHCLRFGKYVGDIEVYWNGTIIGKKCSGMPDELLVEFVTDINENSREEGEITVIIKNTATDCCAGILAAVEIQ